MGLGLIILEPLLAPGPDKKIEALFSHLRLWFLHRGQKPRHSLSCDHIDILGYPGSVYANCKKLNK